MQCEECSAQQSLLICLECDELLCENCDQQIHRGGKRKEHIRSTLCNQCRTPAINRCLDCSLTLCYNCAQPHQIHHIESISNKLQVGVFWDLHTCRPKRPEEVAEILAQLKALRADIKLIRGYGEMFHKWDKIFQEAGVELSRVKELRETDAMMLDLSMMASRNLTNVIILTTKGFQLKAQLAQLLQNIPNLTIEIINSLKPMKIMTVEDLCTENELFFNGSPTNNYPRPYIQHNSFDFGQCSPISETHSVFQEFYAKEAQTQDHDKVLRILRMYAAQGYLLHQLQNLVQIVIEELQWNEDHARYIITTGEKLGTFHKNELKFGPKLKFVQIGIKLDSLSLEALNWTLLSLKIDQMLPSERAIQSRMKEAFGYKPAASQWKNLLSQLPAVNSNFILPINMQVLWQSQKNKQTHHRGLSAPIVTKQDLSLSIGHQLNESNPCINYQDYPSFIVTEICDPIMGGETCVIFPTNNVWEPVDQPSMNEDVLDIKSTQEWQEFLKFLSDHFNDNKLQIQTIPWGRYGCAQFIKMCGTSELKKLSLGKLSYMVQLAINDQILKYQRTQLAWAANQNKKLKEGNVAYKLKVIQQSVIGLLYENPDGISFAQLPLHLSKILPFDFNLQDLGFGKLKDLLQQIPEVKIQLKGLNNPYAVLNHKENEAEDIINCITAILKENKFGLTPGRLQFLLNQHSRFPVQWAQYNSSDIQDFLMKYGRNIIEIQNLNGNALIKINEYPNSVNPNYFAFSPYRDYSFYVEQQSPSPFHSHTNSLSTDYYIHQSQGSGSIFYIETPPEKIINVSNLPAEISVEKFHPDFDYNAEKQRKFIQQLWEGEDDLSARLQGPFPPKYRTGSVVYHSNKPSISFKEFVPRSNDLSHFKTSSEDMQQFTPSSHSRQHKSVSDFTKITPPAFMHF